MLGGLNTSRNRVGFAYVSSYNPWEVYGNGEDADRGKFYIRWLKYGDSADTSVVFKILLDKAATAGDTFQVAFTTENGSYGNDWSWTCDTATTGSTTATVTLSAGQTEVNFTMIAEVAGNQWKLNRIVTATLQSPSARLSIDPDRETQKLALVPARKPPKIRISTAATGFSVATGGSQLQIYTLTLDKSAGEEVPQRITLSGPLAPYCTVTSSPVSQGSTVRNNGVTCDVDAAVAAGLGVGDGVTLSLDYERSDVVFQELDFDPLTDTFSIPRDVHADENLWHWTNDLVAGGTESGQLIPRALEPYNLPLPKFAGIPTPMIYDGTSHQGDGAWKEGRGRPQAKVEEQDDASPVLDPVTGNALKIFCPDATAVGMPYVRESFSKVFCGGPLTAHQSQRHMRVSFVVQYMQGVDAGRNMEFHRVGIRIREANRNHGAVFRSSVNMPDPLSDSRIGLDRYGNSTTVYGPFDGVKFWLWDYGYSMAPQDCGVVEDENGHARLWYRITMDPNVVYPPPSFTNVPDDTGIFCNPIQYPQWSIAYDGSNIRADGTTDRTITVDDIRDQRLGALWHSMQFEMSDTPLNGPPGRFWPKMSHNGWAPLGNASLENNPAYDTSISLALET